MNEIYLEQLVSGGDQQKGVILRVLMVLAALLLCFLVFIIPVLRTWFFILAVTLCTLGVLFFWRRVMREYEYIFTEGQLDVDVIFSRRARKHLLTIDCRNFQLLAPAQEPRYQELYARKYTTVVNAGSGKIGENTYIGLAKRDEKTLKLIFEPNEQMLDAIKKYSPRNTVLAGGIAKPVSMD